MHTVKGITKGLFMKAVPLEARKRLSVLINRLDWISPDRRNWWSSELIKDLSEKDINEYHKFLWSNHLSYASTYEAWERFGAENMKESRRLFFSDLEGLLKKLRIDPEKDVSSVLEVGCSLGYQLRHLEEGLFRNASVLKGIDIDAHAIESGREHLKGKGSKIALHCADMEDLERLDGPDVYDIVICAGVLLYLDEPSAGKLIEKMLRRAGKLLAVTGLAHRADNSTLNASITRRRDSTFIHNIDAMVKKAGGRVIARRWEGEKIIDGHTIYFIFASAENKQKTNL